MNPEKRPRQDLSLFSREELEKKIQQLEEQNDQLKKNKVIEENYEKETLIEKNDEKETPAKKKKKEKIFDFSKHPQRHILLKFLYLGWDRHGFAMQDETDNTIETELLKALRTTKLIESRISANYHRCGRTDKGVSAFSQVVSVTVRSTISNAETKNGGSTQGYFEAVKNEINYPKVLNRVLPHDIRILAWSPVPSKFSARFDCTKRTYKYFFPRSNLNLEAMNEAAQYLVGKHDFRNFCKMNVAAGVVKFRRIISSFTVEEMGTLQKLSAHDLDNISGNHSRSSENPEELVDSPLENFENSEGFSDNHLVSPASRSDIFSEYPAGVSDRVSGNPSDSSDKPSGNSDNVSKNHLCSSDNYTGALEGPTGNSAELSTNPVEIKPSENHLDASDNPSRNPTGALDDSSGNTEDLLDSHFGNCVPTETQTSAGLSNIHTEFQPSLGLSNMPVESQPSARSSDIPKETQPSAGLSNISVKIKPSGNHLDPSVGLGSSYIPAETQTSAGLPQISAENHLGASEGLNEELKKASWQSGYRMCVATIEGTAFLWHQIRAIMTVLLLVGQGKEDPVIVKTLLDVDTVKRKPQYSFAGGLGLNLYDCQYRNINWQYDKLNLSVVIAQLQLAWSEHAIKASMIESMLCNLSNRADDVFPRIVLPSDQTALLFNEPKTKFLQEANNNKAYKPMLERLTGDSLEDRVRHYVEKNRLDPSVMKKIQDESENKS